jgi:hypothetical protein
MKLQELKTRAYYLAQVSTTKALKRCRGGRYLKLDMRRKLSWNFVVDDLQKELSKASQRPSLPNFVHFNDSMQYTLRPNHVPIPGCEVDLKQPFTIEALPKPTNFIESIYNISKSHEVDCSTENLPLLFGVGNSTLARVVLTPELREQYGFTRESKFWCEIEDWAIDHNFIENAPAWYIEQQNPLSEEQIEEIDQKVNGSKLTVPNDIDGEWQALFGKS